MSRKRSVAVAGAFSSAGSSVAKSDDAFRTISEVSDELGVPKHVLRFWESKFPHVRPMKRGGGRRYYRPEDMELLRGIHQLLHAQGYTIKGVQKILREQGVDGVKGQGRAPGVGARPKTEGRAARKVRKTPVRALAPEQKKILRGVIAELEACRDRLTGKSAVLDAPRATASKR